VLDESNGEGATDVAAEATPEPEQAPEPVVAAEPEPVPEPEPAPEPAPVVEPVKAKEAAGPATDVDLFEAEMRALEQGDDNERTFKKPSRGDRIEATVIQVDKDKVFVDLGTKSEGVIPIAELSELNLEDASEFIKAGDKIQVVVIQPEGADRHAVVSKKRADFEDLWDTIEDAFKAQTTMQAQVVDRVKGGLVVDIGVRGFVPATHVGNGKLRNIEKYVGQSIPLKIIEIDRDRKKVVLSNRQADEERRAEAKDQIFTNAKPGDTLEGTVRRLTDYGAFVDLGGVDGLLHISEMSWMRIAHPREMFKEGQKIKVMVLRLDQGVGKISLGHRQVLPDPWNLIKQNYSQNQRFTATVGRLVANGAFVKLPEGAEAFIPTSEMSQRRIRRPDEVVKEGEEVEVQILDLRPEERRMVLSIRAAGGGGGAIDSGRMNIAVPAYDDDDRMRGKPGPGGKGKKRGGKGRRDDDFDDVGRRGFATGGATIGERLGVLKGLQVRIEDDEEPEAVEVPEDTTEETE
jgi:4-hydroxy-3-methylbut-2-enyl diphosphate reductase